MLFFKRKIKKSLRVFIQPTLRFLCEQDGSHERTLKTQLVTLFLQRQNVLRAYLVRVEYADPGTYNVALCLRTTTDQDDQTLVEAVGSTFASIFSSDYHLDIIFLTTDQEFLLKEVCGPFFPVSTATPSTLG